MSPLLYVIGRTTLFWVDRWRIISREEGSWERDWALLRKGKLWFRCTIWEKNKYKWKLYEQIFWMGLCIHSRHFRLERPTVRHYAETENVNWRSPTGSSLWDQGTPWKKGKRTPGEHCPMNELRRAHIGSQWLKR